MRSPARTFRTRPHFRPWAPRTYATISRTIWTRRNAQASNCSIDTRSRPGLWIVRTICDSSGSRERMIELIADKVRAGARVTRDEALALYRHAPTALLGRLAD